MDLEAARAAQDKRSRALAERLLGEVARSHRDRNASCHSTAAPEFEIRDHCDMRDDTLLRADKALW